MNEPQDPSGQRVIDATMRPNIRISHTTNGRVKDYAAEEGIAVDEAYRRIIEAGLAEVTDADGPADGPAESEPEPEQSDAAARARAALADWEPADANTAKARDATVAAVAWLATQGEPQRKRAILANVESAEYADSTLWEKVVQPGLRALVERGVLGHKRNKGYWVEGERAQKER